MSLLSVFNRGFLGTIDVLHGIISREAHVFNRAILKSKVRCHFPKPREVKRINVHGWETRMSTPEGRRVLMRRILKGRHVLSH
ncbi:39S ribosomal protein L34, mitochondrial [Anastrepha obliqua]|uniref:39S ribosomal protein L34, mitochondrial n=1 Tax=Anastrepha ludens TaxID=28586 RepID=UPI0023AE7611|nr:39S ribosomal protein L34, mitochondrial [Anastrepha ludens]XP_054738760.1 39S ribosomal protein L34, mitochondrial [Anastrepha obliqua]